jgi:hypothetical protein
MIFTEGPRGISPFPSGLGVARPRSEPRLLCCPGVLPGRCLAFCLAWRGRMSKRKSGPEPGPERVSGRRGGRELTQAAARVNASEPERETTSASLSVSEPERELTGQTRTDFRHFPYQSVGMDARSCSWDAMPFGLGRS